MAVLVLSLWLAMAIVIFITHGRQEYCLTKHLVIIFNTGFCITLILAALTPCARQPGNGIDRGRYGGRLLQAGCVVVYVTYWTWSAMQSSPGNLCFTLGILTTVCLPIFLLFFFLPQNDQALLSDPHFLWMRTI